MPAPSWAPDVADVAALIRARTKKAGDIEAGTFDADTRPTGDEVGRLIEQACRRVEAATGEICEDAGDLQDDASSMAAMYAAMLVEQSYFPEQTTSAGSSFQSLRALYSDGMKVLTEAVSERCGGSGDPGESVGGPGQLPHAFFDDLPLIGRSTPGRW